MTHPAAYIPIDTTPLRRAAEMFVRLSLAVFDGVSHVDLIPSRAMSRLVRYTQDIARVMREIRTTEIENRRVGYKSERP